MKTSKVTRKKTLLRTLPTKYGITDSIIQDLIKYDIMFPIEKRTKPSGKVDYLVYVDDVLALINQLLENQMKCYELVEKANEAAKTVNDLLESAPTLQDLVKEESNKVGDE